MDDKSRQHAKVASLEEFGKTITSILGKTGVKVVGFKLPKHEYVNLREDKDA